MKRGYSPAFRFAMMIGIFGKEKSIASCLSEAMLLYVMTVWSVDCYFLSMFSGRITTETLLATERSCLTIAEIFAGVCASTNRL